MPDFAYTARDLAGQRVSGTISAASQREALLALGKQALFPLAVHDNKPAEPVLRRRRIKTQLMATTYSQLAALLRSGVPLLKSLSILREQTSHRGLSEILEQIHSAVEEGASLAEAMNRHPRVFGDMSISMIRAGGEGAFMEDALDRVAEFAEKQQELKSRVMGALAYPIFLAVFGTLIVSVLVVYYVPQFEGIFNRLRARGELPAMTEFLLGLSAAVNSWGLVIVGILAAVVTLAMLRLATPEGQIWRDRMKLRLPIVGTIFQNFAVARFCRVLGTLIRNGVPILRALEISSGAAGNKVLAAAIQQAAENISAGEALAPPLAASGHFPRTVVEMIAVAEEANNLETVLTGIADGMERTTWRQLDLAVRLLEPIMLLILAGAVLFVAVALLLPVFKMSTAL